MKILTVIKASCPSDSKSKVILGVMKALDANQLYAREIVTNLLREDLREIDFKMNSADIEKLRNIGWSLTTRTAEEILKYKEALCRREEKDIKIKEAEAWYDTLSEKEKAFVDLLTENDW